MVSKCLNSTILLNFTHITYTTIFIVVKEQRQITCILHYPQPMRGLSIIIVLLFTQLLANAQPADQIRLNGLQQIIRTQSDKIQVVNFWATWCAPCVREIPLFENINRKNKEVAIMLVSMDYDLDPNPEKVYRFIARKNLQCRVVILAEQDPNNWIDKIDKNWSGALPATLIVNTQNGNRKFIQKELHEGDLERFIEEVKK